MRPAFSVILLTTLIGAGPGSVPGAVHGAELCAGRPAADRSTARTSTAGAARSRWLLLAGGLVASFFHLGRPERAWRSATQWRTSWLSREVIVLPAFMARGRLYGWRTAWAGRRYIAAPAGRPGHRPQHRARRARHAAGLRAVRLHRHDLRLPALPGRVAHAADAGQLHPARRRIGLHAGRAVQRPEQRRRWSASCPAWAIVITLLGAGRPLVRRCGATRA